MHSRRSLAKPASSLYRDTVALSLPKGRRVGQPGHDVVERYLASRMAAIGLEPFSGSDYALIYEGSGFGITNIRFANLVGVVPGTARGPRTDEERGTPDSRHSHDRAPSTRRPILIGAHYDSVIDAPCSDDNATAVAVALAVAESLVKRPVECDVVIALFDAEEPPWFQGPLMGSTRFYEDHCAQMSFAGVFILDLIGHDVEIPNVAITRRIPRIRNLVFALGAESSPRIARTVSAVGARAHGLSVFPSLNRYVGDLSDHHVFREAGEPYLFLSCAQGKHYHRPTDDLEWVNMRKVARVYRLLDSLVRRLDREYTVDLREPRPTMAATESDTTEMEIRMIRRALGWTYRFAMRALRLRALNERSDLDAMARVLVPSISSMYGGLEEFDSDPT